MRCGLAGLIRWPILDGGAGLVESLGWRGVPPHRLRSPVNLPNPTRPIFLTALFGILGACSSDELSLAPEPAATREGRWQQDVRYVSDNVARLHADAFHHSQRAAFELATQALVAEAGELSDQALVLGMARVLALLGDGAAEVELGAARFPSLPIELVSLSDGLFLVAVPVGQSAALGGRLVGVGGVPVEQALQRLGEVISHENDYGLGARAAELLRLPGALHALELSDSVDRARLEFETAAGTQVLALALGTEGQKATLVRLERAAEVLTAKNRERYYWHQFLPAQGAMYWQVNRCEEDPKRPFGDYARQFLAELDDPAVRRLILDLRWNHLGKESVARNVYKAMKGHRLNHPGGIVVLVGAGTVGSAQSLALNLRERTDALLIGRPLGQRENTFGDVRQFPSPNYGVLVSYPTKLYARGSDDMDSVQPDVLVPLLFEDWRGGIDRAFEAAQAYAVKGN